MECVVWRCRNVPGFRLHKSSYRPLSPRNIIPLWFVLKNCHFMTISRNKNRSKNIFGEAYDMSTIFWCLEEVNDGVLQTEMLLATAPPYIKFRWSNFFQAKFSIIVKRTKFFEERELKKFLLTKAASWVTWLGKKKFGHRTSTTCAQGSRKAQMAHFGLFWPNQKIVFMSFWVGGASESATYGKLVSLGYITISLSIWPPSTKIPKNKKIHMVLWDIAHWEYLRSRKIRRCHMEGGLYGEKCTDIIFENKFGWHTKFQNLSKRQESYWFLVTVV